MAVIQSTESRGSLGRLPSVKTSLAVITDNEDPTGKLVEDTSPGLLTPIHEASSMVMPTVLSSELVPSLAFTYATRK